MSPTPLSSYREPARDAGPRNALTRGRAWTLALVATFTMAISYLDRQVLAVLAPTVTKELDLTETSYGLLASAFSLAYLFGSPIAGRLVDRHGPRKSLLIAVLLWSGVAAMHSLAAGFVSLFVLRIALGLAESPSFPGAAQTVQRVLPASDRARGHGVLFTGSSLGAMIAPPLANMIAAKLGWRPAFLVTAIVGLVWVPLWLFVTRKSDVRAELEPVRTTTPIGALAVLRHPSVLRAICAVLALSPTVAFGLLWGAKLLVSRFGLQQSETTPYLLIPLALFDLGAVAFGDLAARRVDRVGITAAGPRLLFGIALACTGMMAASTLTGNPWLAVTLIGVAVMGAGGMMALLTGQLLSRVPPAAVSSAGGITAAAQSLAYVIANPLIGWSVDHFHTYDYARYALPMWAMIGGAAWVLWRETLDES